MAINVKHGANPSVVLAARYGAGQNAARRQAQVAGAQSADRRETREDQQEFQREMTEGQRGFRREMAGQGQDFRREMVEGQAGRQRDLMEFGQGLREEDFEFRLTAQQRADQEKYQNALYEVESSDSFSEEEKGEAKRRLTAKLAGIRPLPSRKDPSKFPQGQGVGESWTTPEGLVLSRDAQGSIKKIGESRSQPTYQDRIKAWDLALKASTNQESGVVDMKQAKSLFDQVMDPSGGLDVDADAVLGTMAPPANEPGGAGQPPQVAAGGQGLLGAGGGGKARVEFKPAQADIGRSQAWVESFEAELGQAATDPSLQRGVKGTLELVKKRHSKLTEALQRGDDVQAMQEWEELLKLKANWSAWIDWARRDAAFAAEAKGKPTFVGRKYGDVFDLRKH